MENFSTSPFDDQEPTVQECPYCGGQGYFEIQQDFYDGSMENWYPAEHIRECRVCRGSGTIEVWDG